MSGLVLEISDEMIDRIALRLRERSPAAAAPEPWLNVSEAAAYLACNRQRIYNLSSAGRLRHAKDGSRLLFRRTWLDELLEAP